MAILYSCWALAQKPDTANKVVITIGNANGIIGLTTDTGQTTKLIGNVQLAQGTSQMFCDSAYLDQAKNNLQAFGNVRIIQTGGTQVQSDYLRYVGNKKMAYLNGNVQLTDGRSTLNSQDLTYDMGAKIAHYDNGGTLQTEATTVSSNIGTYNVNTKDAQFTKEVLITDPQYNVTSDDLGWNTGTKVVRFLGPSVVTNDKSTLHTSAGTYDTQHEIAHFTSRSSIMNNDQYVEADKLDYNRNTGYGYAKGHVVAIDTTNHTTLWSGFAAYNEKRGTLMATIKPVLRQENGQDSLFIGADTFYSAPEYQLLIRKTEKTTKGKTRSKTTDSSVAGDDVRGKSKSRRDKRSHQTNDSTSTNQPVTVNTAGIQDTTSRYYTGYRHVRIFSDSLQGLCDSISYSFKDSVMKMIKDPVAWTRRSQLTGDTIVLYTDSAKQVKRLWIPTNALIVSRSGPDKAQLYDQVQGKTLTGYFKNKTITHMVVWPSAESIYYATDERGAYLGVNQSASERMTVFFRDEKIKKILFEQEVKQTITPLDKADLPSMKLSHFQWLEEKKPKSRTELFE